MAFSETSVQSAAGSRSFDFGSDDVLCSFEEYALQLDPTDNGERLDSSAKDLHENRVISPSTNVYGQSEEFSREDLIYVVEKCMKKHADNLTTHLEGISGRLTHLELYCYKLERSIAEFHTDMVRDQSEADLKLKSLKKHVHEVHRTVQIIRDQQELSVTQLELTKLQLSHKGSINVSHSQKNNDDFNSATSENKANYESNEMANQQLTLALPDQTSSPPTSIAITAPDKSYPEKELPLQQSLPVSLTVPPRDHYVLNQANSYHYTHHQQLLVEEQSQNFQPELHYTQQMVQMHDLSVQAPPMQEHNWSQPMQLHQSSSQSQSPRLQTPSSYAPYDPNQQGISILLPAPYSAPQSHSFGDLSNTITHLPPQHNMQQQPLPQVSQGYFAPPPLGKNGYVRTSTNPSQTNILGYNAVYVIDGNRASHLQSCQLGSYPPNGNAASSLISSNHPYVDMIEKAASMGYPSVGVVFGTAESS